MNINRNNYEIWLIDYLDEKLSPSEVEDLQLFLSQNPDIQEEFEDLDDIHLKAEPLVFESKSELRKTEVAATANINEDNYEEHFLASHENDLSELKEKELKSFLKRNPGLQKEYELHASLILSADNQIKFEGKNQLKKKRGIAAYWITPLATAATIALLFGTGLIQWPDTEATIRQHYQLQQLTTMPHADLPLALSIPRLIDVPKTNILLQPELPLDADALQLESIPVRRINFMIAQAQEPTAIMNFHWNSGTLVDAEIPQQKKNSLLGRIIQRNSSELGQRIKRADRRQNKTDKKKEPFLIRFLDNSILVFNTVTGNQTTPVKTYNQDGELLRYQVAGELVRLDRSIPSAPSSE